MKAQISPYYLFLFTMAFIIFTIIGTLTHEYGHIWVAKYFGYKTTLSYGSMTYKPGESHPYYRVYKSIYSKYKHEIKNNLPFPEKEEYTKLLKKLKTERLLIATGGPAQTILTGLLGLLLLLLRKKSIKTKGLKFIDWLSVFLSLFWLREVFNPVVSVLSGLINGTGIFFGGDEANIAIYLGLPVGTVPIILGIFGLIISVFIVFKIIPERLRFTFIIAGFIGGLSGFMFWMKLLGPLVFHC